MGEALARDAKWEDPLQEYLSSYASLVGDKRSGETLGASVRG